MMDDGWKISFTMDQKILNTKKNKNNYINKYRTNYICFLGELGLINRGWVLNPMSTLYIYICIYNLYTDDRVGSWRKDWLVLDGVFLACEWLDRGQRLRGVHALQEAHQRPAQRILGAGFTEGEHGRSQTGLGRFGHPAEWHRVGVATLLYIGVVLTQFDFNGILSFPNQG